MKRIGLVLILLSGACRNSPEPPSLHPWSEWEAGAYAEHAATIEVLAHKIRGLVRWTVEESSAEGYTVNQTANVAGKTESVMIEESAPEKIGEETVRVGDRDYACEVWNTMGTKEGRHMEHTMWVTKGERLPVKWETHSMGGEATVVTAVSLDDAVTAAGRHWDCVRLEGVSEQDGERLKATIWATADVPGYILKSVMVSDDGKSRMTLVLTAFDGKRR